MALLTSDSHAQSVAIWAVSHAGAVVTATMFVAAWLRRRGSSHLRELRVRVRYRGIDCLRWAATPWFSATRAYWLVRYPSDWEIARTLRQGLHAAGISLHDGTFRRRLQREIRLARQAGVWKKFEQMPDSTEVRTPIEDRAVECRILEEAADLCANKGWETLAQTLRAITPGAADPLTFQAICDLWLRTMQPMLLDLVFRQIDKAVCQLRCLNNSVEEVRSEARQTSAAVEGLRRDLDLVSAQTLATRRHNAEEPGEDFQQTHRQMLIETHRLARRAMVFALFTLLTLVSTLVYLVVRSEFRPQL